MAEQSGDNERHENIKRYKKPFWLILVVIFIAILCLLFCKVLLYESADEKLAKIEAARAIPDSENAAIIYNELLADPNASTLLDYHPKFLDEQNYNQTLGKPWLSKEHPQLAAWINEYQYVIDKLLEASEFEKCRFPIIIDIEQMGPQTDRFKFVRRWVHLLSFATNNDIAEGRIESAITKWRCIVQIGNHLRQQPVILDQLAAGYALEKIVLQNMSRFVVLRNPAETHLRKLEAVPLPITNNWAEILKEIRSVEDLQKQKLLEKLGTLDRLKFHIYTYRFNKIIGGIPKGPDLDSIYLRQIATTRGIRILIGLRRYKNRIGRWPKSLDEIKSLVPAEILIDPLNNSSFVYKITDDSFTLYSKGQNNIDEDGQYKSNQQQEPKPDNWRIWPAYVIKDKNTKENTNDK